MWFKENLSKWIKIILLLMLQIYVLQILTPIISIIACKCLMYNVLLWFTCKDPRVKPNNNYSLGGGWVT